VRHCCSYVSVSVMNITVLRAINWRDAAEAASASEACTTVDELAVRLIDPERDKVPLPLPSQKGSVQ
jgi:hypothetical protein